MLRPGNIMAQFDYRASLASPSFPLLSEQMGQSIIVSSNRSTNISEAPDTPQVYYCHNAMPSSVGMDSVGYSSVVPAYSTEVTDFSDVRIVYGNARTRLYLAWTTDGEVYVLRLGTTIWLKLPATSPIIGGNGFSISDVTTGNVNGVSYIWYRGVGAFIYNEASNQLDSVTFIGLSVPDIVGITSSSGYLIAYTEEAVAWSSTIDPTDFTPSPITGSGGGNVADIRGAITFILTNNLGCIIYSDTNMVSMSYTGNVKFPFKFREVNNSSGGLSLDLVAHEANAAEHYVFSKAGLQAATAQRADIFLPEVTDFLAGKRFEDFNEVTREFEITDLTQTMKKKVKFIASRYLIFSYGVSSFTYALVYDLALNKLGKLKIDHVDCFEYIGEQEEVSKESIAFLLPSGEVKTLDFSTPAVSSGVLLLGKFQYSRGRNLVLHEVEAENLESASAVTVTALSAFDGKNTTKAEGYLAYSANNFRRYNFNRIDARNHSILFEGKFNLTTVLITFSSGGYR